MPKRPEDAVRVRIDAEGPIVVDGPVEVSLGDGRVVRSERFAVAICVCRRSGSYPWCDTSHRIRKRAPSPGGGSRSATEAGSGRERPAGTKEEDQ